MSASPPRLSANRRNLVLVIVIGTAVRIVLGVFFTYPRDIGSWILNSENFLMGEGVYGLPGHYYTPVWGYVISLITAVCGFLGIPISQYWEGFEGGTEVVPWLVELPTMEYALMVKAVLWIFDILVAYVLYRIAMHVWGDEGRATAAFALWYLCPLVIIVSSMRVMFENLEILLFLCSLYMMLINRPGWAGLTMGISLLVKPYGMFLGILLIGYSYAQCRSWRYTGTYVLWVVLGALAMMAPVLATGGLDDAMIWLTSRSDNITSGYNVSLFLIPLLLAVSAVFSYLIARYRCVDFRTLMCLSLAITSGTLVVAGNVQYYLVLIPFAILIWSRLSSLIYVAVIAMSVYAGLSYIEWSSQLYIQEGLPGADLLPGLYAIENTASYNWLKSAAGVLGVLVPAALLVWERLRPGEGRRGEVPG